MMNKRIPTKRSIPASVLLIMLIVTGSVAGWAVMAWA